MVPFKLVIIVVLILVILLGIILAVKFRNSNKKHEPDYRTFFIIGIIWLPVGLATKNSGLWIMGLAFLALGLANKDKWNKQKISKEQRNMQMIAIVLGILVLVALVAILLYIR